MAKIKLVVWDGTVFYKDKESGTKKVRGMLTETESNWRIKPLYENRGFDKISVEGSRTFYEFCIGSKEIPPYPDWIKLNILLKKEIESRQ